MAGACPICGAESLERRQGEFRFSPPANIPGGEIVVPDATWDECASCGEQILGLDLEAALENERYNRLGLLRPEKIKEVRRRAGLTQTEMAQFVGVGEKTYTRWESGRSVQNRSSDNLIRLADRHPELFIQLEAQRDPDREKLILDYVEGLQEHKGTNRYAMAAHGAELDPSLSALLGERVRKIAQGREKG
jgi:putative zinc finger/helix-turn-helix YgiT family protein